VQAPPVQQQTAHAGPQQQQPAARPVLVPQLPPAGRSLTSDSLSEGAPEEPREAAAAPAVEGINGCPVGADSSQRDPRAAIANGMGWRLAG